MSIEPYTTPPAPVSARFRLELEFVLCLSNPAYLSHLAVTYPQLLNKPQEAKDPEDTEAACFARYLEYLYNYWKTPEYASLLSHPGAVLRNLEFLQQEKFRKDLINPGLIERLTQTQVVEDKEPGEKTTITDANEVVVQQTEAI